MKVSELIKNAYVTSGVIAEKGEYPDSDQNNTGLRLLNSLIRRTNIDGDIISIISTTEFTLSLGQTSILLPNYVKLFKAQYKNGGVWLDTELVDLFEFRDQSRITSSTGIPYLGWSKITNEGIVVELFFNPSDAYTFRVDGYKGLSSLVLGDEIDTKDPFYQDFLEFFLAKDIRSYNSLPPKEFIEETCADIKNKFKNIQTKNTHVKLSSLGQGSMKDDIPLLNMGGWY